MEYQDIEQLNVENKLMKKSKNRLISFFFIIVVDLVLLIINQTNPLFFFKFNRSAESVSAYGSYQLISWILMMFIGLFLISYVVLLVAYSKREEVPPSQYKKIYNFFDFFTVIPVFFLFVMIINGWFFTVAVVDKTSMLPTYEPGDVVIISYNNPIDENDVIVFEKDKLYIKRVIGMPGDELLIENNEVWINGAFIDYTTGDFVYDGFIEADHYFVLGDNRDNSLDSRESNVGFVETSELIGVVILD